MGASAWSYWVPHTDDIGSALRGLQEDVFRRREFLAAGAAGRATTVDEARELSGEGGTHSILDIMAVSPTPSAGAVAPLRSEEVLSLFGSERPTRADVERSFDAVLGATQERGPWGGSYVTAYRDDQPEELFFFGMSGD